MKVWTIEYRPFIMGGNVYQEIYTDVPAELIDGPYDIGHGYQGWLVTSPNGKTFVAESRSGAFVGPDIKTVKKDISIGDKKAMEKQVLDAIGQAEKAEFVPLDEFWKKLKCAKTY